MKFSKDFTRKYVIAKKVSAQTVTKDNYFDIAQGLYWFATDWHGGQNSQLYSLLSTLGYSPGAMENGPEEGEAKDIYDYLDGLSQTDPNKAEDAAVSLAAEVKRVYDETHRDE